VGFSNHAGTARVVPPSRSLMSDNPWVLDDPRPLPYLMVWKDSRSDGLIEAVRVATYNEPSAWELDRTGCVEIKRTNGSRSLIPTVRRALPRNGGKARFR
jgi:hypothetical protein